MATALITGGTGFVGSHLARVLLDSGHKVRILRRQSSSLGLLDGLPIEHAIGDVLDGRSLDRAMTGCEWVFHVAAVADYWRANRVKMYLVNVNGTRQVLDSARRAGVRRVIVTSSGAAVGINSEGRPADESIPFNLHPAQFPYGHSKFLAEQEVLDAVKQGQDAVMLNPGVILGPGDANQISGSLVVEMAKRYVPIYPLGGVAFIDVRDVAAAHLAAAERGRSGERYLLSTVNISHHAMMKLIAHVVGQVEPLIPVPAFAVPVISTAARWLRAMGITLPIDADQVTLSAKNIYYDPSKAWRELGEPQIDVRQSIEDTYQWYVDHGILGVRQHERLSTATR